ncbi:hypothetical protein WP50_15000 [Lactiplantibacillus plantarum]|nr:hypothetical protein WP50_15000 [Lactiplantibacillus plantarum]
MLESAGLTYHYTNQAIQNQTYIKIDKSSSMPAIYVMAIGLLGTGGYSEKQAIQMAVLPTKAHFCDGRHGNLDARKCRPHLSLYESGHPEPDVYQNR